MPLHLFLQLLLLLHLKLLLPFWLHPHRLVILSAAKDLLLPLLLSLPFRLSFPSGNLLLTPTLATDQGVGRGFIPGITEHKSQRGFNP